MFSAMRTTPTITEALLCRSQAQPSPRAAAREAQHALKQQRRYWAGIWAAASYSSTASRFRLVAISTPDTVATDGHGPHFRRLVFKVRSGISYSDAASASGLIGDLIGRDHVVIEMCSPDNETLFALSHETAPLGPTPHLNASLDDETLKFAVKAAVGSAARRLHLPPPLLLEFERVSVGAPLVAILKWRLMDWSTVDDFAQVAERLPEMLGCAWVRVCQHDNDNEMVLAFGAAAPQDARLRAEMSTLAGSVVDQFGQIGWSYYMSAVGLRGSNGRVPELIDRREEALGAEALLFVYPPAVDDRMVADAVAALRELTGKHIEWYDTDQMGRFALRVSDHDPLASVFAFGDHQGDVLRRPRVGHPDMGWAVGMGPEGELLRDEWDCDEPHLLIAGSSGSGKTNLVSSMLCQLMHNNDPADLNVWVAEPKNELQAFKDCAHVTRFLDMLSTDDSPHVAFAALLSEAITEMTARYKAFAEHPAMPQKLGEARALARRNPDGAGHLNFPYTVIVVEECANYFCTPLPQDMIAHRAVMSHIRKLARESRAAGIHLVAVTQYPTSQTLPVSLKQHCRRIGLPVATAVASRVIIDESGLEDLILPGRGIMAAHGWLQPFRGLLLEGGPDRADERAEIVAQLPADDRCSKLPAGVSGPDRTPRPQRSDAPAPDDASQSASDTETTQTEASR